VQCGGRVGERAAAVREHETAFDFDRLRGVKTRGGSGRQIASPALTASIRRCRAGASSRGSDGGASASLSASKPAGYQDR
jgi:hypothetical protein